jgi:L-alanine-DL-glutamate epimerase-like enolase superfamily enzyme
MTMTYKTHIQSVDVSPLDLRLKEPFGIARGTQKKAANLLVTVELACGIRGYGEAAPFPAFNGETVAGVRAALMPAQAALVGANVRHWRKVARDLRELVPTSGAARCALETALLDAFTRYQHVSIWRYLGGGRRTLRTDLTITTGTVAAARLAAASASARGFRTLKIKVGGGDPLADVERILAVRIAAPGAALLLDANGGFQAGDALALLQGLRGLGIKPVLFEQPVARADMDGLVRVRSEGRVAVAADESAASASDVRALIKARAAQVINIKLMKSGLLEAMDMAWLAREAGLKIMIGGLVESTLAMTMSACFAAGTGGYSWVDLDTPLFLASESVTGGMIYEGDVIKVAHIKEGHGVTPTSAND